MRVFFVCDIFFFLACFVILFVENDMSAFRSDVDYIAQKKRQFDSSLAFVVSCMGLLFIVSLSGRL